MLTCGYQGANKVFQSRECHGRCVIRKLPLAAWRWVGEAQTRGQETSWGTTYGYQAGMGEILG